MITENELVMLQFGHAVFSIWATGFTFLALLWAMLNRVNERRVGMLDVCVSYLHVLRY